MTLPFRHRAEFAAVRTLESAATRLPESWAARAGANAGALAYRAGLRRNVAEENLRAAFPEREAEWVRRVARDSYRHLGREGVAILRMSRLSAAEIVERTPDLVGMEAIRAALADGRGALLVTGHFGNWEVAAASVAARGIPIAAVVRRQGNRLFDSHLDAARHRFGIETIAQRDAPRAIPRLLRRGYTIGLVADQNVGRQGVWVPFFGRPAATPQGPAVFALRFGAALFACSARRLPGPVARYECRAERIYLHPTDDLHADIVRVTAQLAAHLEQTVRRAPEQYLWMHRRWRRRRSDPRPEPSGSEDGTTLNEIVPPASHPARS